MVKNYTFKTRKREKNESLGGYGWDLLIYCNDEIVSDTGAFGGELQAELFFYTYMRSMLDSEKLIGFTTNGKYIEIAE